MRYDPNDVIELDRGAPATPYAMAAQRASGAPVGYAPGSVAYPLYGYGPGMGTDPATQAAMMPVAPTPTLLERLKWPVLGFGLGALTVGGLWFYFQHFKPLLERARKKKR